MIEIGEYRKAWPKGLVTYSNPSQTPLPDSTSHFLLSVGLPKGQEPEWQFSGRFADFPPHGATFGTHGVAPLVITNRGTVEKVTLQGSAIYLNESVEQFAACLTLRKKAGRSAFPLRTMEDFARLRKAFHDVDKTSLAAGSFWSAYLQEVEAEVGDIINEETGA